MTNQTDQQYYPDTPITAGREREKINGYKLQNAASMPPAEDRTALVEGFLYNTDTMFLYAPSGGYKSMVAINLAVAVASGGTFMGQCARPSRVLFVDGELSRYSFHERLGLFGSSDNLDILSECFQDPSQLHTLPPIHIETDTDTNKGSRKRLGHEGGSKGWQSALLTLVEKNHYGLVVFDNVRTLTDGINENDAADITPLNTLVKRLRYLGCAVLVVHHTRKAEGGEGEAVYAGSTNFLTVYNTCIGIGRVGVDGISFDVIKDREKSVADYFRESCWRLSEKPGEGFTRFDAYSAEVRQMQQLVTDITGGAFTSKRSIVDAARKKYGMSFRSQPTAFKALHSALAEAGAYCDDLCTFEAMVLDATTETTNQLTEDF